MAWCEARAVREPERGREELRTAAVSDALVHADVRLGLEDLVQRREADDGVADVRPLAGLAARVGRVARA